ncbi:nitronate monooxygenase [Phytohabitans houttuyneae]|uniref:Propionate 3-nitronate monooxygenase n=2 Tax=Phytohabitans houttuyneae TaxID=1076126 RepID=A0A6V8K0G7_9ACTN|nr:nitronate monooxygenase [Phytohabitans houttuyneae]
MAGGISTPRLAAAVAGAGGLGSIAGAMLGPDAIRAAVAEARAGGGGPLAVNLFAPLPRPTADRVAEWAALTGVAPPARFPSPPDFAEQLAAVVGTGVPVFSFTFGIPPLDGVEAFTIGTATTVEEAVALERAGVDAVVAQGFEAGGHRGTFLAPVERSLVGTLALVPQVVDAVSVPVIASGGIMDGRGVAAALRLGAQAVQLGTCFIRCTESGASDAHKRALAGAETAVTKVLTGRHARAVRTPLVDRLEASGLEPPDYPLPRSLSPEPPMLAGQGARFARELPAAELMAALEEETSAGFWKVAVPDHRGG